MSSTFKVEEISTSLFSDSKVDASLSNSDMQTGVSIINDELLEIDVNVGGTLNISLDASNMSFDIEIGEKLGGALPYYTGAYEVTPKTYGQILSTKNKSMAENVRVFSIPYFEVSNPQGGKTVTIGEE